MKHFSFKGLCFATALLMASGLVASACSSSNTAAPSSAASSIPPGPIKIGALFSLSGPLAVFGANEQQVENILVNRLNSQGGIDGHQVQLIVLNDQGNPSTAVSEAAQLVQDHVAAVMYPGTSSTNLQTSPVFMKAKIPVITYDPLDTWANGKKWPYFFDTYPLNKPTMQAEANFLKAKGMTKVALLQDDTPFAAQLVPDFTSAAKADGIQIVGTATYPATAVDVSTEVARLQATGAKTLVLIAQVGVATVYAALNSAGWSPTIMGTAVNYFEGYSSLGQFATKSYANCQVGLAPGTNLDPQLGSIVKLVEAKTGSQLGYASTILNVNDGLLILKYAIDKTHSLNGPKIAAAVETIRNQGFTSPQYPYTFTVSDHAGWPASGIHVCQLSPVGQYGTPILASAR